MSMPSIDIAPIEINNAINNIVASIALMEAGIAHILNAEGEKLEKMLELAEADPTTTVDQIAQINASVGETVLAVGDLEEALSEKLQAVLSIAPTPAPVAGARRMTIQPIVTYRQRQ